MSQTPLIIMGVQGTGKSTVGKALADRLGLTFIDGDDLHPAANKAKMASGIPLTDEDRAPWLDAIGETIARERAGVSRARSCAPRLNAATAISCAPSRRISNSCTLREAKNSSPGASRTVTTSTCPPRFLILSSPPSNSLRTTKRASSRASSRPRRTSSRTSSPASMTALAPARRGKDLCRVKS